MGGEERQGRREGGVRVSDDYPRPSLFLLTNHRPELNLMGVVTIGGLHQERVWPD